MIKQIFVIGLLLLSVTACAVSNLNSLGENCISESLKENDVTTAKLRICSLDATGRAYQSEGWRWGAEGKSPKNIIASFKMYIGDEDVFVPLSSYSDLSMPDRAEIMPDKSIVINGGDAATAYTAVLTIKDLFVIKRRVWNNEFKNKAWEETTYSYNL